MDPATMPPYIRLPSPEHPVSFELRDQLQSTLGSAYHLERELDGGGMARVFVAEDDSLHRQVVVKVLSADLAAGVSADRFRREIQVAAHLHHPHIVPVLAAGQTSELLYYTMPLIEGESLRSLLQREKQLPLDRVLVIARDVADALDYAHQANIVHRDIKPDNILIQRASGHAVVTDFGIARAIEKAADIASVTSTGLTLGTPMYMSPEQAAAERHIDGRSDIYSLGCVLYEMLGGAPPFTGPTARAVIAQHLSERPRSLLVVRPDLPTHVDDAIQRALAKVPAGRFHTAAELSAALAGHVTPQGKRARWYSWRSTGLVLTLLGVAAFLVSRFLSTGPPERERDPGRIAVLYLEAPDADVDLVDVARGITRDLIVALQRVPELTMVSEHGIRRFGTTAPMDSVIAELGVGTVLHGSVRRLRDSLFVDVHLMDARDLTEHTIQVSALKRDYLGLRDSVVIRTGALLRRSVDAKLRLREWHAGTRSPRAWQLRQRAQETIEYSNELPRRPSDFQPQIEILTRAESLLVLASREDGAWTEPLVARGWIRTQLASLVGDTMLRRVHLDTAGALAERAMKMAPSGARELELRGLVRVQRFIMVPGSAPELRDSAERDLRAATLEDSRRSRAWNALSTLLDVKGDEAGALDAARRAITVDEYLPDGARSMTRLVFAHLFAGANDSARALCREALRRYPADGHVRTCELSVLGWSGSGPADVAAGWRSLLETERTGPYPLANGIWPPGRFFVAAVLARSGMKDSARAVVDSTRARLQPTSHRRDWRMNEAHVRLLLGDEARALDLLEEAVRAEPALRQQIARLPWYRPLHAAARYQRIVASP
jgi:eukaryotic-like serine/threonine-protein kinase